MSTEAETISVRRKTKLALIEGYNSGDMDKIMAPRTEDCTHEVVPGQPGHNHLLAFRCLTIDS
jgi:hypothetical protein